MMMSCTVPAMQHCGHCGCYHTGQCPRIKAIEYHENGQVKRVEYHDPGNPALQPIDWAIISKPGAAIEVKSAKIPEYIQSAISNSLQGTTEHEVTT